MKYRSYALFIILKNHALLDSAGSVISDILVSRKWSFHIIFWLFLAHLAFRPSELLSSLFVRRPSSTFHILIFSSETTGPIATKLWWNGPWMAPFQNYVRWSRFPTKMAAKLKIEKMGDEILIVHCCFSICQNELKF